MKTRSRPEWGRVGRSTASDRPDSRRSRRTHAHRGPGHGAIVAPRGQGAGEEERRIKVLVIYGKQPPAGLYELVVGGTCPVCGKGSAYTLVTGVRGGVAHLRKVSH